MAGPLMKSNLLETIIPTVRDEASSLRLNTTFHVVICFISEVSRWRNGLARLQQWPCYLQGTGFESHLAPVEFFTCN